MFSEEIKRLMVMRLPPEKFYLKVEPALCVYGMLRIDDVNRINWEDIQFLGDHIKVKV